MGKKIKDLTVLVLDDDESMLMIMEMFAKKAGVKKKNLHVMEHSLEAVKLLKKTKIDVIISDVQMPDCDGFELCQHLAHMKYKGVLAFATASGKNIRDCLVSMNDGIHHLNMVAVLPKPLKFANINSVLLSATGAKK